jgi:PKD repeat protein
MNSDNVFFFNGHGNAGILQMKKFPSDTYLTAIYSDPKSYRLSDHSGGEFDDIALAVYEGCNTANTGVKDETHPYAYGNLLEESNKAGIDNALGFQEEIWDDQATYWAKKFWPYLTQGYAISTAANMAADDTYHEYISTNGYGSVNSWKLSSISGSMQIIRPPRAGAWNLPPNPTITTTMTPSLDAPVASFTCSWIAAGTGHYHIQFTDTSTNNPSDYYWEFDDDGDDVKTSIVNDPIHDFYQTWDTSHNYGDTFSVSHSVKNPYGADTFIQSVKVVENNPCQCSFNVPEARFSWAPDTPHPAGTNIAFTDQSTNSPATWYWEFGDGTISTIQSPSHPFASAGTFTVRLTAANCAGGNSVEHTITVNNPSGGTANNKGEPTTTTVGGTVQFTDLSTPTPQEWNWSFGDGGVNSTQNPDQTYTRSGKYTVNLTVKINGAYRSKVSPDYITVLPQDPHTDFTASPTRRTEGAPLLVQFNDTSTNDPNRWSWNFGDGGTSADRNASHQYQANGTYTVSLMATNSGTGSNTVTKTNYITVGPLYALTDGAYTVVLFNKTGSTVWTPPSGVTQVDYLVVGGGGEGGIGGSQGSKFFAGGGGGAGGLLNGSARPVVGPQTVVVGAGGANSATACGAKGGDSVFGNSTSKKTAKGGGEGRGVECAAAGDGGSGGGGSGATPAAGPGESGQGFKGGDGFYTGMSANPGGGGGGAGAEGQKPPISTTGGDGGDGKLIAITGTAIYYGGGGGGGMASNLSTVGAGGEGCGGNGSMGHQNDADATCQGTGGGGGGAGGGSSIRGAGGSGVVIIRYLTPMLPYIIPLPGHALPTDPDDDGNYEDVNGDGNLDFTDVELFFKQLDWIVENEPPAAFDYNGNNLAEFDDIVHLFKEINS